MTGELLFSARPHHLPRRPYARIEGAMRGGEKIRRGGLARKEQPAIDRRGEHGAFARMARQRMRVGAARERIERPARLLQGRKLAAEIIAEKASNLVDSRG